MDGAKSKKKSDRKLVGVRVDPEIQELLDLAVFFEDDVSSIQELLEPVLKDYALSFGAQPEVVKAMKAKREYAARNSKKLARLPEQAAER